MKPLAITPYAAALVLLYVLLSVRTLLLRRRLHIAFGDAGNTAMLRAVRAHGNFAEYVPLCLLMVYGCEVQGLPSIWIHVLGIALLAGRLAHATGVSHIRGVGALRVLGMSLTLITLLVTASYLLVSTARQFAN